jgi:hypothetical protein
VQGRLLCFILSVQHCRSVPRQGRAQCHYFKLRVLAHAASAMGQQLAARLLLIYSWVCFESQTLMLTFKQHGVLAAAHTSPSCALLVDPSRGR